MPSKAAVNVGNGSLLSYGKQSFEAKSIGDITAGGYIKAAGAGATWVDVDNQVTSNNNVLVGSGGSLQTAGSTGDITLAAVDNMDITFTAVADMQGGAVGGASSHAKNTLNRNNAIAVDGSLYSMNDINLYAGKDKDGKLGLTVESEAYNKTALAVAKPKLNNTIQQNNHVTLGKTATGKSVRNINLYGDSGDESIRGTMPIKMKTISANAIQQRIGCASSVTTIDTISMESTTSQKFLTMTGTA